MHELVEGMHDGLVEESTENYTHEKSKYNGRCGYRYTYYIDWCVLTLCTVGGVASCSTLSSSC